MSAKHSVTILSVITSLGVSPAYAAKTPLQPALQATAISHTLAPQAQLLTLPEPSATASAEPSSQRQQLQRQRDLRTQVRAIALPAITISR
jgi:hypothetical protein